MVKGKAGVMANPTYQPFLPRGGGGHVVVPLRKILHRYRVLIGCVSSVDYARKAAA